ncbi:hypothetical protein TTHERM_00361700 (macronuclear) [Tetrahymena thermophila SB210]|uniref:Uncharacterized protein n=1 Tax=Tetrahymena thermophila (strain SB210) TaxID=312017 RepID=Q22PH4_TETTS|nr:hypothetical protein TTHERM_00361700 [Tetrahymena thermophila SB210]EAR87135.1 hypothetical protein TTHERM_00361700 [Tetrahymena thermophila SB210]|eukprot:XP_001007380.1 hypothetical protein TTHERM_00361700 [Tetrahymena thermophila SB210]
MRSRKSTDEKRDSSTGLANYTEQNRKIMFDISPRKKKRSSIDQKEVNGSPTENNNKRIGLLQPLKLLQEQIQKRQQKVQESIEEHKKITSSNQILKSSQKIAGNDKSMNQTNQFFGSKFENTFRNLQKSPNNNQNAALKISPPTSSFKLGIISPPKNQTSTIETDSIMSRNDLGNSKHEIKSKKTKKLQNIFRVITMMNKKMKIKKKDKDTVFFNRYIKEYEHVDTYFNVKQVFQQLNPLNKPTPSIVKRGDDLGDKKDIKNKDYSKEINDPFENQAQLIEENEDDKSNSSSEEEDEDTKINEKHNSQKGEKSSSLNSKSQSQPQGMSLLKRLFQKNNNQAPQNNFKNNSESRFAQKKAMKKVDLEELNTQKLMKLLQSLQNSYQIEDIKVKEDEEENQDDLFYDSLHKQLIKALSQEPNGHEKSNNQLNFWQEREIETINFQIKKAHEHNRKVSDMRNSYNQSLIENKYLEFKKKSDQALKLLKKGGYKIYRSKLKQIEEEEKMNRHIMETIERFEQFNQKIKYKPMHHQHFSHKSINSQKQISAVLDNQTEIKKKSHMVADKMMQEFMSKNRKSIVCSSLPYSISQSKTQNFNKGQTLNFSKTIQFPKENNNSIQKNEVSFQLNKENLPLIDKRRSSLTSDQSKLSSQYSICQSKVNPRKTIGFKDLQQSPSFSKRSIDSKITQKSIQEIYLTEQKITIDEKEAKQPEEHLKGVGTLDFNLINSQIKDDYILQNKRDSFHSKIQSPSSKEKKSSNKTIQFKENIQNNNNMFLSTNLSPTINKTHHNHSKSLQQNSSPFNKQSNLKKTNSFAINNSPLNQNQKQMNFSTLSNKNSSNNQTHKRRNTIMNVFALNKKQSSNASQFSNQQSPKINKVNEENMPLISSFGQQSPKFVQIENIKQQEDTVQLLRRRSSTQHKTVIISSPSQIQRKVKRTNTVHFQENDSDSPKVSNFSKELNAYKLQEQLKYSPQVVKAKSLISQIFKRPEKLQIAQIKEKEFFPQLDFYRQKSFQNLEDTYHQNHQSFCTAVEKRNKRIQNQYSLLKQKVVGNSQSLSETPTSSSNFYNSTSHSQNQKSNQPSTFYSSKSPLILLKDHLRKVSAFQQKYSNKVQTLLYDLDFAQEENTFVKGQMIRTVNDSCKSYEQITSQISPQLECIRDLFEQSTQDTKNKKPFIQKATIQKKKI